MSYDVVVSTDSDVIIQTEPGADVTVAADFEVVEIDIPEQGPPGPPGPRGNSVLYGVGPPPAGIGINGDFYIDTATHFIYGPKSGGVWPAGVSLTGPQGPRGNSVLYGSTDPTGANGVDGDFWINTTTHFIFGPKASGAWPAGTSLIGPQGPQGAQGVRGSLWYEGAGAPGTISGALAEDNYLNTTNGDVYTYSGTSWGSPVGNIRGPQGVPGPQGNQGVPGATGQRGSLWYEGAGAPGTISGALANDNYLNVTTGDVYNYSGSAWGSPVGNIRGPQGPQGPVGQVPEAPTDGGYYARRNSAWVAAVDVGAVRFDAAQALTDAQAEQARKNVYAAPFDALAYNGMQINGACEVSQERPLGQATTTGYFCDGWATVRAGTSAGYGFLGGGAAPLFSWASSYQTTAQAVMGAGDYVVLYQPIEGWRVARLGWGAAAAQPMTIGFWSCHARPGLYSVAIKNGGATRSYAATYNHAAANVAQWNVITIPGDTTGTWAKDNTSGVIVVFTLACGSTYTAPAANTWYGGNYNAVPGQVNGVQATSESFRIGNFIVLPGVEAPPASRSQYIMRPFDQELTTCQRYLRRTYDYGVAAGAVTNTGMMNFYVDNLPSASGRAMYFPIVLYPPMRVAPTVQTYSPGTGAAGKARSGNSGGDMSCAANYGSSTGFSLSINDPNTAAAVNAQFHWEANARL
ncbi:hypothetical protein J4G43_047330 [Bradyrhizobium barranii subsp. barranii]|uniref:Collagen-like protein n=1 Tax=Bradyrhizobium barranii subsp. barranii TaxID=2823807 RepID=A0A939MEJ4_9BRAD|nr:hypothetical protein [Bradyrhizobium barranii]UEM11981.1 hypothetical protein J4G43_047330 [Bradyrhizobium barranii subsp. barranii]